MSEWPKYVHSFHLLDVPDKWDSSVAHPVIPADLGRELYEQLKAETEGKGNGPTYKATVTALARYEREVGK